MRSSNYTDIIDWLEEAAAQASQSQDIRGVQSQIDLFWRFVASLHSTRSAGHILGEDERLTIQDAQIRLAPYVWWLDEQLEIEQRLETKNALVAEN